MASRPRHLSTLEIAEQGAAGFERAERELAIEQAVRGLDALAETEIQEILASAFESAGWGVLREVAFPTPPSRRAKRAERDRCDIVLTPGPGQGLSDAVERAREEDERRATLFDGIDTGATDGAAVDPRDAVWIEVKTLGQFTCRDGVPGPNGAYGTELVRGAAGDARKLASDGLIERAAAVIVLFAATERVVRHDVQVATHRMLDLGAPIGLPEVCCVPIADRIGNGVCAVVALGIACGGIIG